MPPTPQQHQASQQHAPPHSQLLSQHHQPHTAPAQGLSPFPPGHFAGHSGAAPAQPLALPESDSSDDECKLQHLPLWLLQDTVEVALASSAAGVQGEVALERRRVAVCFMEDTDVDVESGGKTRSCNLPHGVYDGRVMEVCG